MKPLCLFVALFISVSLLAQKDQKAFEEAKALYEKKNLSGALKSVNKAIEINPKTGDYYSLKADILYELKDYQGAYDNYSKAILFNPQDFYLYNQRGNLLLSSKLTEGAISDFEKVVEFAPNDTVLLSGLINLGTAKSNMRDFKGAYADFKKAFKIDSNDVGLLNNMGHVCFELGYDAEGFDCYERITKIQPDFIGIYVNLGYLYQLKEEYEKSLTYLNKAIDLDPNEAFALSNRSYTLLKLGRAKEALKDIEKSIKLFPGNSFAYRNRALIYFEMGEKEKACADLLMALQQGFTSRYGKEVEELQASKCK